MVLNIFLEDWYPEYHQRMWMKFLIKTRFTSNMDYIYIICSVFRSYQLCLLGLVLNTSLHGYVSVKSTSNVFKSKFFWTLYYVFLEQFGGFMLFLIGHSVSMVLELSYLNIMFLHISTYLINHGLTVLSMLFA